MTRAAYDAIEAMNWSSLKAMHVSPLAYQHGTIAPREDTAAFQEGRACHVCTLEPDRYAEAYVPAFVGDRRTKAGKAAWADYQATLGDREPLTAAVDAMALGVRSAVERHQHAARLLSGGRAEVDITWTDGATGIACKGRLDYVQPSALVDLKTTASVTPRLFATDAARYLYHGQLAWYLDGAIAAKVLPPDAMAWIVAVEKKPPHDVACYAIDGADLDAGRRLYRGLLQRFADCQDADWWPGVAPDPLPLGLPRWAPGMAEVDDDGENW